MAQFRTLNTSIGKRGRLESNRADDEKTIMKHLPLSDFRARRLMLEDDDFAISSGKYKESTNLVDEDTWNSIISLSDDVSIRTSDMFGPQLQKMWRFWDMWNRVAGAVQEFGKEPGESAIAIAACDASDEFQGAIHCALVGYYRVAFSCLRNVLEQTMIALQLDISRAPGDFDDWLGGEERIKFGWAADMLSKSAQFGGLEEHLKAVVNDTFFGQAPKGFARRLFMELSKYTHGVPEFTDWDLRRSTGPVFVPDGFRKWSAVMFKTYLICLHGLKLVYPELRDLPWGPPPMNVEQLRSEVVSCIAHGDGDKVFFHALPSF